jgi:bacterioferritin-associated ferredoxin
VIVCHCNAVSDRSVAAAVAAGACSVAELARRCGAGLDCGGCHRRLEQLLERIDRLVTTAA